MLTKVAKRITSTLVENNLVSGRNQAASQYGMEMLIAYALNISSTIALGIILRMPLESIFMAAAIVKLRGYNGGIHAPTHLLCYILSMITIFASLKSIVLASSLIVNPHFLMLSIFPFCGIIFLLSPVEDYNKSLDDLEKSVYRQRGLAVLSVTMASSLALIMLGLTTLGYSVGMAIIITSISMVAGYIKNRIIDKMEK